MSRCRSNFAASGEARAIAAEALDWVGLGHRLGHYPGQLSGGEQQRVAMARALAAGARVMLCRRTDRQSRPGDRPAIMELLFRLQRERSTTLLLVTHDHALARRCDRVLEVRDGRIAAADRRGGC